MIRLAIFDLDGTLLNTIADLAASTNHVLQQHGYPVHELPAYRYFVGNGITRLIEKALPEDERSEANVVKIRNEFIRYYQEHITDFSRPYDGIRETLSELQKKDITLAVASNKYHQGTCKLVGHFFENNLFSMVLGQREGIPTKPDPSIVREILTTLDIDKADTLYIGDSGVDMQTALNSGLTSVGVTWGFRPRTELEAHGACHIIDHPLEILNYIK